MSHHVPTPIYVLCPEGQSLLEPLCPVWEARRVKVAPSTRNPDNWNAARAKALRHAADSGAKTAIIFVHSVRILWAPHWNGCGPETHLHAASEANMHALWMYMDRLLQRFAHVYVPMRPTYLPWSVRRNKKMPFIHYNNPTTPYVAGYQLDKLMRCLDMTSDPTSFGHSLCLAGYDSFTLLDYYFNPAGLSDLLTEPGSHRLWQRAYDNAIRSRL